MKELRTIILRAGIVVLFALLQISSSQAQFREGAIGISAGMAMPSGVTLSAAVPSSYAGNINNIFTYYFGSSFAYVIAPTVQLELGLGYGTASYSVPQGQTAPPTQSTLGVNLGGKIFLASRNDMVMPYIGAGFSYVGLPKSESTTGTVPYTTTTSITGSIISVLGCFGAQGFLNAQKTVAIFVQFGLGYSKGTLTTTVATSTPTANTSKSADNSQADLNLGGSAFGFSVYF